LTDGPWTAAQAPAAGDKRHAPATARNRDAIVAVLERHLPEQGLVLEVASGSGEHVLHFARAFPSLDWQPSDPDEAALRSIAAWSAEAGLPNVRAPVRIDASRADWPVPAADAILCINMIHISPWEATLGLLSGAARLLPPGGLLYTYGPYLQDGVETAPSNRAFDASLRAQNPAWGIRSVAAVAQAAAERGLALREIVPMPANNLSLIFRRDPSPR
jgi:SAM-dependent methyltransferase